jgi:hypothetical protein
MTTDTPKRRGYGRLIVLGVAVTLGFGFLRYIGYSPGQLANQVSEPTNPSAAHTACLAEHQVHAAPLERAVKFGHTLCTMHGRGEQLFNGARVDCLLEGVSKVGNEAGLATLMRTCAA